MVSKEKEVDIKLMTVTEIIGALAKELNIKPKKLAKLVANGEGEKTAIEILKELVREQLEKDLEAMDEKAKA